MSVVTSGEKELFLMLVKSVEAMDWQSVYDEWCKAGYNRVQVKDRTITLDVRRGQRIHNQLETIVSNQLKVAGFRLLPTRNWTDRHDRRFGLKVVDDTPGHPPYGQISFTILGFTWIEVCVRAQYLLHLLGVSTHYGKDQKA